MIGKDKLRWQELCAQAAIEQDPDELTEIVTEIKLMLDAKSHRLADKPTTKQRNIFNPTLCPVWPMAIAIAGDRKMDNQLYVVASNQ